MLMLSTLLALPGNYAPASDAIQRGLIRYSGIESNIKEIETALKRQNTVIANIVVVGYSGYRFGTNKVISAKIPFNSKFNLRLSGAKTHGFVTFNLRY